jgi:DDB1- and CUL4-associated factor 6
MIAVSGIDHTIKVFSPDARARWRARNGIGVSAADASSFSSLEWGRRTRRTGRPSSMRPTSEPAVPRASSAEDTESEDEAQPPRNGLSSKRKFHEEYQITSANEEAMRDGNRGGAFISRSVLNQLVAHLQERINAEDGGDDEDAEGEGGLVTQLFPGGDCRVSATLHLLI